eukprot:14116191-Alexandrium_andersonii.AAC.1
MALRSSPGRFLALWGSPRLCGGSTELSGTLLGSPDSLYVVHGRHKQLVACMRHSSTAPTTDR